MSRLLDPRTFPVDRIAELVHALPAAGVAVDVADVSGADEAVAWLSAHGRPARLVPAPVEPLPTQLWDPSPGLVRWLDSPHPHPPGARQSASLRRTLPLPGRGEGVALDLGCGTGRDAVWLALHGWRVTALDRLPDALDRARSLAELYGVRLDLVLCDLERDTLPEGPFDLVTAFRYLPPLGLMAGLLAPGGTMIVETFTDGERERTGKPRDPKLVLPANDPPPLPEGLELVEYRVSRQGRRELATLVAKRMLS